MNFGQPKASHNCCQALTTEILWSAFKYQELGSALVNLGSLVSLCTVQVYRGTFQLIKKCELNVVGLVLRSVIFFLFCFYSPTRIKSGGIRIGKEDKGPYNFGYCRRCAAHVRTLLNCHKNARH